MEVEGLFVVFDSASYFHCSLSLSDGDKPDEIELLENFDKVIEVCLKLKPGYC